MSMIRSSRMSLLPAQASVILVLQVSLAQTTTDSVALLASHESIKRAPVFQLSFKRLDSFSSAMLGQRAQERVCCPDSNRAASTSSTCLGQGKRYFRGRKDKSKQQGLSNWRKSAMPNAIVFFLAVLCSFTCLIFSKHVIYKMVLVLD